MSSVADNSIKVSTIFALQQLSLHFIDYANSINASFCMLYLPDELVH
jgi:hypothetical protein